jgi:hypothetical protein
MGSQSGRSVAFTEMTKNLVYEKNVPHKKRSTWRMILWDFFSKPRAKRTKETK